MLEVRIHVEEFKYYMVSNERKQTGNGRSVLSSPPLIGEELGGQDVRGECERPVHGRQSQDHVAIDTE